MAYIMSSVLAAGMMLVASTAVDMQPESCIARKTSESLVLLQHQADILRKGKLGHGVGSGSGTSSTDCNGTADMTDLSTWDPPYYCYDVTNKTICENAYYGKLACVWNDGECSGTTDHNLCIKNNSVPGQNCKFDLCNAPENWDETCNSDDCSACEQCTMEPSCDSDWCNAESEEWSMKCTYRKCETCSQCNSTSASAGGSGIGSGSGTGSGSGSGSGSNDCEPTSNMTDLSTWDPPYYCYDVKDETICVNAYYGKMACIWNDGVCDGTTEHSLCIKENNIPDKNCKFDLCNAPESWDETCKSDECAACEQCSMEPQCQTDWCANETGDWSMKCTYRRCETCSQCSAF